MTTLTGRAKNFRDSITAFIEERRDAKLKGDDSDGDSVKKYEYSVWLADAASRAHNLKVVTHPIKFTHGAIKGATSIRFKPDFCVSHSEVGTHVLKNGLQEDFAINDAKHLDVYSLLTNVIVEDKSLLEWVISADSDLLLAMHEDPVVAESMLSGFNGVIRYESKIVSSPLAKQVFWLQGDDPQDDNQYHLLQPMFSSSLEEEVHKRIRVSRDSMFIARGTKKQAPTYEDHSTYLNMVERTLGGSNAQNVSPRNKARGGVNYLLSSLPPKWTTNNPIKLLQVDSVLGAFRWFEDVPHLLKSLSEFLLSDPQRIKETREKREELEQLLGQQLALFGESIRFSQEPGWTRNSACCLPLCEKLWLDPERTELPLRELHESEDADFNSAYAQGDWPDQVASRFANWLNNHLHEKGLTAVGDVEHKHWAKQALLEVSWPASPRLGATGGAA